MHKLFAKNLLKTKREAFCSQQEIISLVNANLGTKFKRPFYTLIENGERSITPEAAIIISRILHCDVEELFESVDKTESEANESEQSL